MDGHNHKQLPNGMKLEATSYSPVGGGAKVDYFKMLCSLSTFKN